MKANLIFKDGLKSVCFTLVNVTLLNSDYVEFDTRDYEYETEEINGVIAMGASFYQFTEYVKIHVNRKHLDFIEFRR